MNDFKKEIGSVVTASDFKKILDISETMFDISHEITTVIDGLHHTGKNLQTLIEKKQSRLNKIEGWIKKLEEIRDKDKPNTVGCGRMSDG